MDPLVPRQQLPLGDTGFFLQPRVLIDKLHERNRNNGSGQNCRHSTPRLPRYEKSTDLFLDKCQLFKVPFQERHLLLLSFAVAVSDDIVVLFTDLIQLNLQLDHLTKRLETPMNEIMYGSLTFSHRFCKSRMRFFLTPSNSASCTLMAFRARSRSCALSARFLPPSMPAEVTANARCPVISNRTCQTAHRMEK